MKCPILFSRKNKKNVSKCGLMKFLPSMQSVVFHNFYNGDNFCDFMFIFSANNAFSKKGSTLKGKNLLPIHMKF